MKHVTYTSRTLASGLDVYVNCSKEQMQSMICKKLKDKNINIPMDTHDNGMYFTLENGNDIYRIVWVGKFDWSTLSQGLLVHELVHFVMASFNDKGIPISKDNEETFAYFLEDVVRHVFWCLLALNPIHKKRLHKRKTTKSRKG